MKNNLYKTAMASIALLGSGFSANVMAHGYVSQPESRGYLCKLGENTNCGAIQYEPQSLEALKGFPQAGPKDGEIASAGHQVFSPLNEQTPTRWVKRNIEQGSIDFVWTLTANHSTAGWEYFITKDGWDQSKPLSRSALELTPFCSFEATGERPPKTVVHQCSIPSNKQGYHQVLAVWTIADTVNAFYNVIDVNITGDGIPVEYVDIGDINPSVDLNTGDKVLLRAFDQNGEVESLGIELTISDVADGANNVWPKLLAEKVNSDSSILRAGVQQGDVITPALGKNDVFTQSSTIIRTETEIVTFEPPVDFVELNLDSEYLVEDGKAEIDFELVASESGSADIKVLDNNNDVIHQQQESLSASTNAITLQLNSVSSGQYSLIVDAINGSGDTQQLTGAFTLKSNQPKEYDFVYPDSIENYKDGTLVLGSDGNVYQCRPFPYEGWCTVAAPHYVPGEGSDWEDAWILLD